MLQTAPAPITCHPKLLTVSSTQSVGNIDVLASRASRVSNKSDGSNGEVTTTQYITKAESGSPAVARFRINQGKSHLTARVSVGGLLSAFGHDHMISMRDLSGDAQLTPDTIEPASLRMTIKSNSAAETGKGFSKKDRQSIAHSVREEAVAIGVMRRLMEVGPGGKQIQLEDPDGNPIELFEPAQSS